MQMPKVIDYKEQYKAQSFVVKHLVSVVEEQKKEIEKLSETVRRQDKAIFNLKSEIESIDPLPYPQHYLVIRGEDHGTL